MSTPTGPFDLAATPVHLFSAADEDRTAVPVENFHFDAESFAQYTETLCADDPGRIVMIEVSPTDWPAWECHQRGDEVVIVLEGSGVMHQQHGNETQTIAFKAGDCLINPRGVWHTADVTESMRAIYITPCPGTEHRPRSA